MFAFNLESCYVVVPAWLYMLPSWSSSGCMIFHPGSKSRGRTLYLLHDPEVLHVIHTLYQLHDPEVLHVILCIKLMPACPGHWGLGKPWHPWGPNIWRKFAKKPQPFWKLQLTGQMVPDIPNLLVVLTNGWNRLTLNLFSTTSPASAVCEFCFS